MVCCRRARYLHARRAHFQCNHLGAATGADGAVRRSCARAFCAVEEEAIRDHFPRPRGANPALLPRREVASRHHRPAVTRASWHRCQGVGPDWPAAHCLTRTTLAHRSLSPLYPCDAGEVPDADREPPLRHGARTWLLRWLRSLSPRHLKIYKYQPRIEKRHALLKSTLEVAPIRLKKNA